MSTIPRVNPIPSHWVADGEVSADAAVAHDAYEACDARALALMVGLPATISIGSDSYAAKILRATATTLIVAHADDPQGHGAQVFRLTKRGWRNRSFRLAVGQAIAYLDPSF